MLSRPLFLFLFCVAASSCVQRAFCIQESLAIAKASSSNHSQKSSDLSSIGIAIIIDHTKLSQSSADQKSAEIATVEKSLQTLGFHVTRIEASDKKTTLQKVNDIAATIPTNSQLLVYYTGPMVQGEQKINSKYHPARFLIPADFEFKNTKEVRSRCVGIWELEKSLNQSGCKQLTFLADSHLIDTENKDFESAQRIGPFGEFDSNHATLICESNDEGNSLRKKIAESKTYRSLLSSIKKSSSSSVWVSTSFSNETLLDRSRGKSLIKSRDVRAGAKPGDIFVNSIGQVFCWVPAGEYVMGSPASERHRSYDENEQTIKFDHGFWISKYEVTEREYFAATKRGPRKPLGKNYPYTNAKNGDGKRFADGLNKAESATLKGWTYQLPNESQWEYACRAGSQKAFHFGDDPKMLHRYGNFADASLLQFNSSEFRYADPDQQDQFAQSAPVGSFLPNAWGIHDMHGNVWEWCSDTYREQYLTKVGKNDKPFNDRGKSIRGGSWLSHAHYCRSAMRNAQHDQNVSPHLGFRIILIRN